MPLSIFIVALLTISYTSIAQNETQNEELDSVLITSTRIHLPFKESSRTITVISSIEIMQSPATNVAELLQQFAGVDTWISFLEATREAIRIGDISEHDIAWSPGPC